MHVKGSVLMRVGDGDGRVWEVESGCKWEVDVVVVCWLLIVPATG